MSITLEPGRLSPKLPILGPRNLCQQKNAGENKEISLDIMDLVYVFMVLMVSCHVSIIILIIITIKEINNHYISIMFMVCTNLQLYKSCNLGEQHMVIIDKSIIA